jgi:uncharacterized protein YcfJ
MRHTLLLTVLMTTAGLANADSPYPYDASPRAAAFWDKARVVSSVPITQDVNTPQQQCWTENVTSVQNQPSDQSLAGTIIGGLAGGILGHTVGGGSGKDLATAAGAVTGAVVGNQIGSQQEGPPVAQTREEQHCRTYDHWTRQITGYRVTYHYRDREFTSVLPYDPGQELRVSVSIAPSMTPAVDRYGPPAPPSYPPPPPDYYPNR